uniref:Uncharacterized protein n=1 Tax=Lactuca sativa TaxID=4236 RepID=A0A9R1UFP8_LACSA|nr:hypothetical protein LSAT_V11C900455680 [Lactuca sativa]
MPKEVVTVTMLDVGTRLNAIPDSVSIAGTYRSISKKSFYVLAERTQEPPPRIDTTSCFILLLLPFGLINSEDHQTPPAEHQATQTPPDLRLVWVSGRNRMFSGEEGLEPDLGLML